MIIKFHFFLFTRYFYYLETDRKNNFLSSDTKDVELIKCLKCYSGPTCNKCRMLFYFIFLCVLYFMQMKKKCETA